MLIVIYSVRHTDRRADRSFVGSVVHCLRARRASRRSGSALSSGRRSEKRARAATVALWRLFPFVRSGENARRAPSTLACGRSARPEASKNQNNHCPSSAEGTATSILMNLRLISPKLKMKNNNKRGALRSAPHST